MQTFQWERSKLGIPAAFGRFLTHFMLVESIPARPLTRSFRTSREGFRRFVVGHGPRSVKRVLVFAERETSTHRGSRAIAQLERK